VLRDPPWKRRFGTTLDWPPRSRSDGDALSALSGLRQERRFDNVFRRSGEAAYAKHGKLCSPLARCSYGYQVCSQGYCTHPNPTQADDCFVRVIAESQYARLSRNWEWACRETLSNGARVADKAPTARSDYVASITSGLMRFTHKERTSPYETEEIVGTCQDLSQVGSQRSLSACVNGYVSCRTPDVALIYLHELLAMNREAKAAQVLMHHNAYIKQVEQPAFSPALSMFRWPTSAASCGSSSASAS